MAKRTSSNDQAEFQTLNNNDKIDHALWFQYRLAPARSVYPEHGHAWGEFIYAYDGMMDIQIGEEVYIIPPHQGLWLPPHVKHRGMNHVAVSHGTLYVHERLCESMPKQAGILLLQPLGIALFDHLKCHDEAQAQIKESQIDAIVHSRYQRLLEVSLDQLYEAEHIGTFLPSSSDPSLKHILEQLQLDPANQCTMQFFAQQMNMSERTLARHCQNELGMSLNEWRQRLKVMKAIDLLHQQQRVESIALDLGYANASAFIGLFKRWMNCTPEQFRQTRAHSFTKKA